MTLKGLLKLRDPLEIDSNNNFYNLLGPSGLQRYAEMTGLVDGADIDVLQDLIRPNSRIMELGAGYGRVIKKLLSLNLELKIEAFEKSASHLHFLNQTFRGIPQVKISNIDVFEEERPNGAFDAILWMWSGFGDRATPDAQKKSLFTLRKMLSANGILVLDLPENLDQGNQTSRTEREARIELPGLPLYTGYVPIDLELIQMIRGAGYSSYEKRIYVTSTNRKRACWILHK